jgi:hypothetical protein
MEFFKLCGSKTKTIDVHRTKDYLLQQSKRNVERFLDCLAFELLGPCLAVKALASVRGS